LVRLTALGLLCVARAAALTYDFAAEWRLIPAGTVRMSFQAAGDPASGAGASRGGLEIRTGGMVGKLYPVEDLYSVFMGSDYCAVRAELQINEGKRRRKTLARFENRKARFEEQDLLKNTSVQNEIDIPACVHDVVGGLLALRQRKLSPGGKLSLPVTDGKKFANVEVQVLGRETIRTPAGTFPAVKCEVFLMNGVVYQRPGRLFVWISDDDRRLPVQIQVRLQILIGTITLQLVKEES
jgi:hypothetical protein